MRAERSDAGSAQGRGYPSPRAGSSAPRSRPSDRNRQTPGRRVPPPSVRNQRDDDWGYDRGRDRDRGDDRPRGQERIRDRDPERGPGSSRRPTPPERSQRDDRSNRAPVRRESVDSGPQLRGTTVVLGMFVSTLVAAAVDSYLGVGLGMITLVALLLSSVAACLRVRRRDLLSVVVAPPLVFLGVALANIALAPSATLSLPTIATLLIRGFPAMGLAVAVSLLLFLFRLSSRR